MFTPESINALKFTGLVADTLEFLSVRGQLISNAVHLLGYFSTSLGPCPHISWRNDVTAAMNWLLIGDTGCGKGESQKMVGHLFDFERRSQYLLAPVRSGLATSGKVLVGQIYDTLREYDDEEGEENRFLAIWEEYVAVFNALQISTNKLHSHLISLSDGGDIEEHFRGGKVALSGVHFGSIGHITPTLLVKYLTDRLIEGGLANRLIFAYVPRAEYRADSGDYDKTAFTQVQNELQISLKKGSELGLLEMEESAKEKYLDFHKKCYEYDPESEKIKRLAVRFPQHCLKIALTIALINREEQISLATMESACTLMEYSKATLEYLFMEVAAPSLDNLIRAFIEKHSPVTKTQITQAFANKFGRQEIDYALNLLLTRKLIDSAQLTGARGRRTTIYTPITSSTSTAA